MTQKARNKKRSEYTQEELDFMQPELTKAMKGLKVEEKQKINLTRINHD